ncbi:dihydrodipicolinate synthase family protein [Microlunatus sp. Y2014]|uniref:dihydrodipicolinate synthase family protein n=1 Tax=Microlunatus sp. Y2014 TaxID=3418488 RepID=UPI003DA6F13B
MTTDSATPPMAPDPTTNAGPLRRFAAGTVIPAQPLALTEARKLDEVRQQALSRYYLAAGAGGVAVGVHSTQFEIHYEHKHLLKPVLRLALDVAQDWADPDTVMVAGVCGPTGQAVAEAERALQMGYHATLLAPHGASDLDEAGLLDRARAVAEVGPVIGFYLQPKAGGRLLSAQFWQALSDIEGVIGIKAAPFDRYATADVLWGVAHSARADDIALYTGNDDHIIGDLLLQYPREGRPPLEFVGGLLGQWSLFTREAVRVLELSRQAKAGSAGARAELDRIDVPLTDINGALFDRLGDFAGGLPGIHEGLRRQGLFEGLWCLNTALQLSPGQLEEIDRVWDAWPQLRDDDFVTEHLASWGLAAKEGAP